MQFLILLNGRKGPRRKTQMLRVQGRLSCNTQWDDHTTHVSCLIILHWWLRFEHRASQTKCLEPAQTLALSKRLGPGSLGTATAWQLGCSTALGLHELPRQWACGSKTGPQQEPPKDGQSKHALQWHQLASGWLFHACEPEVTLLFVSSHMSSIPSSTCLTGCLLSILNTCILCLTSCLCDHVYPKHVLWILPVFNKLLAFLLCLTLMSFIYPICCLAFYKRTECSQIIFKTCYRKSLIRII